MADLLAIAETLEAQAASLRREAARQAADGQAELALEPQTYEWHEHDGGEQPPETVGKVIDVRLRDGYEMSGPAHALTWGHGDGDERLFGRRPSYQLHAARYDVNVENEGARDIIAWRLSAEQPDA